MAKVLCMEIGAVYTKIVEMDYQAKKPKVYRCLEVKTPEGAVKDGYLADDRLPALQETIKAAVQEALQKTIDSTDNREEL